MITFYNPIIVGALLVLMGLIVWLLTKHKESCYSIIFYIFASVLLCIYVGNEKRLFEYYFKITDSPQVKVEYCNGSYKTIDNACMSTQIVFPKKKMPTYISDEDYSNVASIVAIRANKQSINIGRLCKLGDSSSYSDVKIYYYEGNAYCFLSDKFMYNDVILYLPDDYAMNLIENILE